MSQRNEDIDRVMDELERYGLRGEISDRGKHLEIAWTTPQGRRFVIAARTASDWRSGLNLRSDLRKLLKADNLQPKRINDLTFQRAMSLPKEISSPERILQKDVDALVDLVFDLQSQIVGLQQQNMALQDKMNSITVVSRIEFAATAKPEDAGALPWMLSRKVYNDVSHFGPFRQSSTQGEIMNCLTDQFRSVHEIVKQSGVNLKYVSTTLWKAKKLGFVESGLRGEWRRKP